MAVEKMIFLNIFGKVESLPAVAEALYENAVFHPEQATQVLRDYKGFYAFSEINPYDGLLREMGGLITAMGYEPVYSGSKTSDVEDKDIENFIIDLKERNEKLRKQIGRAHV